MQDQKKYKCKKSGCHNDVVNKSDLCPNCELKKYVLPQRKAKSENKKIGKKRVNRSKDFSKSTIKKELDILYSLVVRMEAANEYGIGQCVTCLKVDFFYHLQNGHFIQRSVAPGLIFHRLNTHPQCVRCNIYKEGNRFEFIKYMNQTFGEDKVNELYKMSEIKTNQNHLSFMAMCQEYAIKFKKQCERLEYTPTKEHERLYLKYVNVFN